MTNFQGKTAGGDLKKVLKEKIIELQNLIHKRDAEISRLMHRVTYVKMINNQTEAENCLLRGEHFVRWWLMRLVKK